LALQGRAVALQQNLPAGLMRRMVRLLACPQVLFLARRKRVDLGVDLAAAAALANPRPPGHLLGLGLREVSGSRRLVLCSAQQLVGSLVSRQRAASACRKRVDSGAALVVAHRSDLLLRPPLSLGSHQPLLALETGLLPAQPQVMLPRL
jgi:hypothetical protein